MCLNIWFAFKALTFLRAKLNKACIFLKNHITFIEKEAFESINLPF